MNVVPHSSKVRDVGGLSPLTDGRNTRRPGFFTIREKSPREHRAVVDPNGRK
jgi:hypothetical protein